MELVSFQFLNIRELIGSVEERFFGAVHADVSKPAFFRDGFDPLGLFAGRSLGAKVDIKRAVCIRLGPLKQQADSTSALIRIDDGSCF